MTSQTLPVNLSKLEKLRFLGKHAKSSLHITCADTSPGKMEEFSSSRHHLDLFKCVGITANFTCPQTTPISLKNLVFHALTSVLQKQPNLSTIVIDEHSDAPYFARLPVVNLEKAVRFIERKAPVSEDAFDEELDIEIGEEHNKSFKSQYGILPFWRMVILTHPAVSGVLTVSFFFHHSLADGTSAILFLKDFQEGLNTYTPGTETSELFIPENKEMLPSLESLLTHPQTPSTPYHTQNHVWVGEANQPPTPKCGKFHTLVINKELSSKLVQACKAHKTTITSLLPVLLATSLFQILPEKYTELNCVIPVNIRKFLSLDETAFGVYIDALTTHHHRPELETSIWDQVADTRAEVSDYLAKAETGKINIASLRNIPSLREMFRKRMAGERNGSFDVSNLGVVRSGEGEGWKLGRTVFSRSAFVTGAAVSTSCVTGGDGCMVLRFAWQEGAVESGLVEEMVGKLTDLLNDVAKSE